MQARQDKARRLMAEHSTLLQLYHTSEERMARLKENTRRLAETIGNLATDITQYVHAASEKLDLAAGLNPRHGLVDRMLSDSESDPALLTLLASAVYSAVNRYWHEITDDHERDFHRALVEHALTAYSD